MKVWINIWVPYYHSSSANCSTFAAIQSTMPPHITTGLSNWASEASPTLGCSIEISRDIYIAYYTSKSGIWLVISLVVSYFHEPKASANTAYE